MYIYVMRITEKALANLEQIKNDIPIWIKDAIINNKEDILNIIKYSQLGKGLNSDGNPLKWSNGTGEYAPSTQEIANNSMDYSYDFTKTEGSPYNFFWSGKTFNFMNLSVDIGNQNYDIFTTGGKQTLLESIYGEIFKLTDEHNKYVNENIIQPYISKKILENMLKF